MTAWGLSLCALALLASAAIAGEDADVVRESARKLPVAYDVDVVVVGGGAGAVAAAQAAAKDGAKVFLAAPRTYLGEDVAGTLRVWAVGAEKPATPLAEKLFGAEGRETGGAAEIKNRIAFAYKADKPSAAQHKDTSPPSALFDGKWQSAATQSVQYDGEVTLTADLGKPQQVEKAGVMAYHAKDFLVESVAVSTSDDGKEWKDAAVVKNTAPSGTETSPALALATPVSAKVRYVKLHVKPAVDSKRLLIGEIIVTGPEEKTAPAPETAPALHVIRPLHIKRTLDEALIGAGVQFLYGCYACDVLRDAQGNPSGIVMANRAGRQAVLAKVIVDATDRAWVARMAGAKSKPFPAGTQTFQRVVIGGELRTGDNLSARTLPVGFGGRPVFDYTLKLDMPDGSYPSWARAEQAARTMTYHPDQESGADFLFQVPPDPIETVKTATGDWAGAGSLDLDSFRPAGVERVFVLGGCAGISRSQAAKLLEPPALVEMGARIGAAAAALAKPLPPPRGATLSGRPAPEGGGDVKELLTGVRATQNLPTIEQTARGLPVLGRYDVVVVGGGTSGAPAGIAAARQGAKTLVLEYQCALGGVGTIGMITTYYWGNCVGFTKEVLGGAGKWKIEPKAEWWRSTLLKAGGEIWFGAMGCGAYVEGGRVRGAVVATPQGRGVVLANVVIDATGNADVAAAAGATCITTDATDVAQQGTGLPPRNLGASYTNTDYTIVDETDMLDVWQILVYGKQMAGNSFDFGTLIDTRERRRIVGDFTITILDEVLDRTYPDTILQARSNFDTHGYTVDPYFTLNYPHHKGLATNVPYRSMLPQGLEGLLVVGLGMSIHRDAMPVVRMQPDLQNGGYAAGVAAAMASKTGTVLRGIEIKALQQHLVQIGNLKESVLTDKDSFPLPPEKIEAAVNKPADPYRDIAIILSSPNESRPLVKRAFEKAQNDAEKTKLAQLLSALGDAAGLDALIAAVEAAPQLDKGWSYVGMGQFGASMSPLDSLIYALGRIGDRKAAPAIVAKLKLLKSATEFSHFRAIAYALDQIRDPAAAGPLADVLAAPGVRGQAITAISGALDSAKKNPSWTATAPRAEALRELFLARALFHCGDRDGLGRKVLEEYAQDLRGHLARHASAVLQEAAGSKK